MAAMKPKAGHIIGRICRSGRVDLQIAAPTALLRQALGGTVFSEPGLTGRSPGIVASPAKAR